MKRQNMKWHASAAALLFILTAPALAQPLEPLSGTWRIVSARQAPWHKGAPPKAYLEHTDISFSKNSMKGEHPLSCQDGKQHTLDIDLEGLFEGNLTPKDATQIAQELGLPAGVSQVNTFRFTCRNASFDFHFGGNDRLFFALDNVIYTAGRKNGAR